MTTLSERRMQLFVEHAQIALHGHENARTYREVLEWVDEIADLLIEVRRERAALDRIAAMWDECVECARGGRPDPQLAVRMCAIAREVRGLSAEEPSVN